MLHLTSVKLLLNYVLGPGLQRRNLKKNAQPSLTPIIYTASEFTEIELTNINKENVQIVELKDAINANQLNFFDNNVHIMTEKSNDEDHLSIIPTQNDLITENANNSDQHIINHNSDQADIPFLLTNNSDLSKNNDEDDVRICNKPGHFFCENKHQCEIYDNLIATPTGIIGLIRNDSELSTWTGIPSFKILNAIKDNLELTLTENLVKSPMKLEKIVIMTFIKLKMNMSFTAISTLFGITDRTVSKNFYFILKYLRCALSAAVYWPSKDEIAGNMPKTFKKYQSTRVVLDCFELKIPALKCLTCRIQTYSHYKGGHTCKFCLGVTPAGMISYLSPPYGGRASDKFIFNNEKIITSYEFLPRTDSIMVDKGFFIESECNNHNIKLIRPPFLKKQQQLTKKEAEENANIAASRVHVERCIQRIRIFKIMTQRVEWNILPYIDDIASIVSAVVNLNAALG